MAVIYRDHCKWSLGRNWREWRQARNWSKNWNAKSGSGYA